MSDSGLRPADPTRVAERYEVLSLLGRGGMGAVYRVRDRSNDVEVALKRLSARDGGAPNEAAKALFEREFHTLNQLVHRCVVRAYDYGHDGVHPYYTMELLDGDDLRAQAPLPAARVCAIAYELCSVLGLLHARRLVHRDVTPRNIRLSDGGPAKLLDFGLLSPMGPCEQLAGTPPYVAPEVVHQGRLDGRSDLYSLGATLYYVLTGCAPFSARRLKDMRDAWRSPPLAISSLVPDVPEPLERLVMSLMRLDINSRPKTAAEVMECLRPLLADAPDAALTAARAHLTAPALVGRDDLQIRMRKQLIRSARGRGGGFVVEGDAGTGRSRMLDVFVLEAKLLGAAAARAGAPEAAAGHLGVAAALARQLHESAPGASLAIAKQDPQVAALLFENGPAAAAANDGVELRMRALSGSETGPELQTALRSWVLGIAAQRPVAIAVDDLGAIDGASQAWLAGLSVDAGERRVTYALAAAPTLFKAPTPAIAILKRHARTMTLAPMTHDEMLALLRGVFGDVPNLQGLCAQLHPLVGGKPRECMQVAQHLVDRGHIEYRDGAWQLPSALDASAMPANMDEALRDRVRELTSDALEVGQLLALNALPSLSRRQLEQLTGWSGHRLTAALEALRQAGLVVGTGSDHAPAHDNARAWLVASATESARATMNDRLADHFEATDDKPVIITRHRLLGSTPERGLDHLLSRTVTSEQRKAVIGDDMNEIGGELTAVTLAMALDEAERRNRPATQMHRLWGLLASSAALGQNPDYFHRVAPPWATLLKRSSGYQDWQELRDIEDPATRALQAFAAADARYQAAPEAEDLLSPLEAIGGIVWYATAGIGIAARTYDASLFQQLRDLATPFAPLSPVVDATMRNTQSSIWIHHGRIEDDIRERDSIIRALQPHTAGADGRLAMSQVHGSSQSRTQALVHMGVLSAAEDKVAGSDEPSYRVSAEHAKRAAALYRGDWESAEAHRQRAELLTVQNNVGTVFAFLGYRAEPYILARDLTGLREITKELHATADRHPHWQPISDLYDAHYFRLSGQPDRAHGSLDALEAACRRLGDVVPPPAVVARVQLLTEQGRHEEALALGSPALEDFETTGRLHHARELSLYVSLAEAELGQTGSARRRLEAVLAQQLELGIEGLRLGRTHEYLARVAIVARDRQAFERAAERAAQVYRVDQGSMLALRYRRLLEAAQRAGLDAAQPEPTNASELANVADGDLAQRVLATLCEGDGTASERTGGVFLLTAAGLTLCAANWQGRVDEQALGCFAQAQLELELDDDTCTQGELTATATSLTMTEGEGLADGDQPYVSVPLRARHDGVDYVIGIALLDRAAGVGDLPHDVLDALALRLIASDRYCPRPAA